MKSSKVIKLNENEYKGTCPICEKESTFATRDHIQAGLQALGIILLNPLGLIN